MKCSPDLRSWSLCDSRAKSYAFSSCRWPFLPRKCLVTEKSFSAPGGCLAICYFFFFFFFFFPLPGPLDLACACLLYTSDAADDLLCVDLGGRRIIKKKKKKITSSII